MIANASFPANFTMRLFSTAALAAALFATTVIAGMEQLAAVLPSCAVGSAVLLPLF